MALNQKYDLCDFWDDAWVSVFREEDVSFSLDLFIN